MNSLGRVNEGLKNEQLTKKRKNSRRWDYFRNIQGLSCTRQQEGWSDAVGEKYGLHASWKLFWVRRVYGREVPHN